MATFYSVLDYTDTGEEIPEPVSIDLYPAQGNQGLRKVTRQKALYSLLTLDVDTKMGQVNTATVIWAIK